MTSIFSTSIGGKRTIPLLAAALLFLGSAPALSQTLLDAFESTEGWTAAPSDGVELQVSSDEGFEGRSMRLDIDYQGHGGYAVVRKPVPLTLPENYEFSFRVRGTLPPNNLEFKLIDPTGDNVWWLNRRAFAFSPEWQEVRIRRRHIEFAWGPLGGGTLKDLAAIELAITAGQGGRGSVWIDSLRFRPLEPDRPYTLTPKGSASSGSASASRVLDRDPSTLWSSRGGGRQHLTLDFLREREFGGAIVDWGPEYAADYDVQISQDGKEWVTLREVRGGNGGRDYLFLPETSSRFLRLLLHRGPSDAYRVRTLEIQPLAFSASRNDFFRRIAQEAPRGSFPRYFTPVQSYWTVTGLPEDEEEVLINEEGMVEVGGVGGFSLEPFLALSGGRLLTWADVETAPSLEDGTLPIPSVTWSGPGWSMKVTAMVGGAPGRATARAEYAVRNTSGERQSGTLWVAIRPFQVNPPWQFLGVPGGVARIDTIETAGRGVRVNRARTLLPSPRPARFGATAFDGGSIVEAIRVAELPGKVEVTDPFGAAEGAFEWPFDLAPGESETFVVETALHGAEPAPVDPGTVAADWRKLLSRVEIDLPPSADDIERTIDSTLAYILINQDGGAIQPGSRAYDRSWIRDGSMTSAALLRLGSSEASRRFITWYAPYQFDNGKVPCCVDARGADPVPENDSHGELIFAIAEYVRFTDDLEVARSLWPNVLAAIDYMELLRAQRMTEEYRTPAKKAYFGLLPESISHEGYSAKPMHSYWDQFFALKGYKDAAWLAGELAREACITAPGLPASAPPGGPLACGTLEKERVRLVKLRDEYRRVLLGSLQAAMAMHGIDYLPGAVELGDFDATSTTVALTPVGELETLPRAAVEATFERYWQNFVARRDTGEWDIYTPYEWRVVGSLLRLGWVERAHEAARWFMTHRRPPQWNGWSEAVWNDPATPKFVGDIPHTWVGSDFLRSMIDFLAWERDSDRALVLGSGIPLEWARAGVTVRNLRTPHGPLSFRVRPEDGRIRVDIDAGLDLPEGGIEVALPFLARPSLVRDLPATLLLAPDRTEMPQ